MGWLFSYHHQELSTLRAQIAAQNGREDLSSTKSASGLTDAAETRQVSTLLYCLGEEAEDILCSTGITVAGSEVYETVINKFDGINWRERQQKATSLPSTASTASFKTLSMEQ